MLPSSTVDEGRKGEAATFENLYRLHKRRVFAVCLRLTRNVLDAEDLTQEVFLQVHRKGRGFRGEAAFGSWLYRVAVNTSLMFLRRRRSDILHLHDTPLGEDVIDVSSRAGACSRAEPVERIALTEALRGLPKRRRSVVVLHDISGLTHREVGKCLGVTAGTSKSQLRNARRTLRDVLKAVPVPVSGLQISANTTPGV